MKKIILFLILLLFLPRQVQAENKVVINEFLAHPSSGNKEWVEFYNPDKIDLSSYWIDDDPYFTESKETGSNKKLLSSEVLNSDNSEYPFLELSSFLNNSGDYVVFFDQNGTIIDQYKYTKDPGVDVSMGRSPDGQGDFQILASTSKGSPNADPMPTVTSTVPVTSTPSRTPTPTREPTPTKIPTPTKLPTPTKTVSSLKAGEIASVDDSTLEGYSDNITEAVDDSVTSLPETATISGVLEERTHSSSPAFNISKNKKVLVKEMKTTKGLPEVFIFIGIAVIFISCAILLFVRMRESN